MRDVTNIETMHYMPPANQGLWIRIITQGLGLLHLQAHLQNHSPNRDMRRKISYEAHNRHPNVKQILRYIPPPILETQN